MFLGFKGRSGAPHSGNPIHSGNPMVSDMVPDALTGLFDTQGWLFAPTEIGAVFSAQPVEGLHNALVGFNFLNILEGKHAPVLLRNAVYVAARTAAVNALWNDPQVKVDPTGEHLLYVLNGNPAVSKIATEVLANKEIADAVWRMRHGRNLAGRSASRAVAGVSKEVTEVFKHPWKLGILLFPIFREGLAVKAVVFALLRAVLPKPRALAKAGAQSALSRQPRLVTERLISNPAWLGEITTNRVGQFALQVQPAQERKEHIKEVIIKTLAGRKSKEAPALTFAKLHTALNGNAGRRKVLTAKVSSEEMKAVLLELMQSEVCATVDPSIAVDNPNQHLKLTDEARSIYHDTGGLAQEAGGADRGLTQAH